jgi:hypothetical protein
LLAGATAAAGVAALLAVVATAAGVAALLAGATTAAGVAALLAVVATAAGIATLLVGAAIFSVVACTGKLTNAHKVGIIKFFRDELGILYLSNTSSLGEKNNFVVLEINTSTADILCIQHTPIGKNNQFLAE